MNSNANYIDSIPNHPISTNAKTNRETDGHYYWIDCLRFMAAFMVMAGHYREALFSNYTQLSNHNLFTKLFFATTRIGFEAVIIFFTLSGILVGGKTIIRIKNNTFKPLNYAIDRSVRIMLPLSQPCYITLSSAFLHIRL